MKVSVVIPNWNGEEDLPKALDSLLAQSVESDIIVVENGSTDGSFEMLRKDYPDIEVIRLPKNAGFVGVNRGIELAIQEGAHYVALLNNDAVASKDWLEKLLNKLERGSNTGIATSKILNQSGEYFDSTGDIYTIWGLPFPRGRREAASDKYDNDTKVFGASGGATMYRVEMLKGIGLFDEDFFAYYEDIDLSFRAQLAGWNVAYVPAAVVTHVISLTSSRMRGFGTYQTMKNLPWIMLKNVPRPLFWTVWPRLTLAYSLFFIGAVARGNGWSATKGLLEMFVLIPKKLRQRKAIQASRKVPIKYINSIITHDLPPNAGKLRSIRGLWWKLRGRHS